MICLVWILTALGLADLVEPSTEFRLILKTCDVKHADTNASANLVLLGEAGATSDMVVIPGDMDRFNIGSVDKVNRSLDFDGPLCAVKIRRGEAGSEESWKLQWLAISYSNKDANFSINVCDREDDWMEEKFQKYTRKVNGNWGLWGPWFPDRGHLKCLHHRYRSCDKPAPACGGTPCMGNNSETKCGLSSTTTVKTTALHRMEQPRQDDSFLTVWMVFAGFLVPVISLFIITVVCYRLNGTKSDHESGDEEEFDRGEDEILDVPEAETQ